MISLIPYIRETFRRHLSQKQAVMLIEFDKLKRVRDPLFALHLLLVYLLTGTRECRTTRSTRMRFMRSLLRLWATGCRRIFALFRYVLKSD